MKDVDTCPSGNHESMADSEKVAIYSKLAANWEKIGREQLNAGAHADALKSYGEAAIMYSLAGNDLEVAITYSKMRNAYEALRDFDNVAFVDMQAGHAYGKVGAHDRAGQAYERAAAYYIESKSPYQGCDAYMQAGGAYERAGLYDKAEANYEVAGQEYSRIESGDGVNRAGSAVMRCSDKRVKAGTLASVKSAHG